MTQTSLKFCSAVQAFFRQLSQIVSGLHWVFAVWGVLLVAFNIHPAHAGDVHAVLIGVSRYPALSAQRQLKGPLNDVTQLASLLRNQGVANITILADGAAASVAIPTRQSILDAVSRVTDGAQRGDWLILYFSGHGTQQPATVDIAGEKDRLDEVFLPGDADQWDARLKSIKNGLIDDQIAKMIQAAMNKGISVWAIFDTCHAGTMSKDPLSARVWRYVPPAELGVPAAAKVAKQSSLTTLARYQTKDMASGKGQLVAFYASQDNEPTPEERLLPNNGVAGIFSWQLAKVLARPKKERPDFGAIMKQIQDAYRADGRVFPTPFMEGAGKSPVPF